MSVILVRQGPLGFLQQTITGSPTIAPVAIVGQLITYCPAAHCPGRPETASQEWPPGIVHLTSAGRSCHSIIVVATNTCLSQQNTSFDATKVCLSLQTYFCCDKLNFSATNTCLSRQNILCRDQSMLVATNIDESLVAGSILLSRQKTCCVATKHFVETKMILVAATANDSQLCSCFTCWRIFMGCETSANELIAQPLAIVWLRRWRAPTPSRWQEEVCGSFYVLQQ